MKLTYRPKIVGLFTIVVLLILIFFGGAHFHKDQIWPFGQGYYLVIKDIKKYGINYKEEKKKIAEEKKKIAEKKRKAAEKKRKADELKKFDKNKMYYWIIGDSGAFGYLPRLSCLKHKNHIFLTNGLGQVDGDSIILLHNKEFSEYVISSKVIKIETLNLPS